MELIKIENSIIGNEKIDTVNARDLHEKLEVDTKFADWIKRRLGNTKLVDGQDFIVVLKNENNSGRPLKEYHLTLDTAKHIALQEGGDIGHQIRQYFIDFEKKARQILQNQSNHPLMVLAQQNLQLTAQFVQLEEEQKRQSKQLKQIEAKQDAILKQNGFYSVMGYANLKGAKITLGEARKTGKEATKISEQMEIATGTVPDPRYGEVKTYHESVLEECSFFQL